MDTPEEAEAIARSTGLEVEWGPNRFMRTKYTVSAFEYVACRVGCECGLCLLTCVLASRYCPYTDRNLLYAAVADDSMWFDTWPGVRHLPTMETVDQSHEYAAMCHDPCMHVRSLLKCRADQVHKASQDFVWGRHRLHT